MPNYSKIRDPRFWKKWRESGAVAFNKTTARCDHEIFQHGEPVAALDARSEPAEKWVQRVARRANARVDWHYSGGIAQVLHLGDAASRQRVEEAITHLEPKLDGRIMRRYEPGEAGLYRNGVTPVPAGTIAGFMDPLSGDAVYVAG